MSTPAEILDGFTATLRRCLAESGVSDVRWRTFEGHLVIEVEPRDLLPHDLHLLPASEAGPAYARNAIAALHHAPSQGRDPELAPGSRELLAETAAAILDAVSPAVLAAAGRSQEAWSRVGFRDPVDMVLAGLRDAALVPVEGGEEQRAALEARLPCAVTEAWEEPGLARCYGLPAGWALAACARDPATAAALLALERRSRGRGTGIAEADALALGRLLGWPSCCALAWRELCVPRSPEPRHVQLARVLLERGGDGISPAWIPPLNNALAASLHGFLFFDHLPCAPGCAASLERNRVLLDALYPGDEGEVVRSILGLSFVVWPDGRFLPFRVRSRDGEVIQAGEAGRVPWPLLLRDDFRPLCVPGEGLSALRRVRGAWQGLRGGAWRPLAGGSFLRRGSDPMVCLSLDS
ncbi:MAG: hypothetical protein FJ098_05960 [Deltaproteobacteria bacterium]|nr:hypothetical protein [Deltaproteobacteria bacterium]